MNFFTKFSSWIYFLNSVFCVSWCGIRIFHLSWHHQDKEREPVAILWHHLTDILGVLDAETKDSGMTHA